MDRLFRFHIRHDNWQCAQLVEHLQWTVTGSAELMCSELPTQGEIIHSSTYDEQSKTKKTLAYNMTAFKLMENIHPGAIGFFFFM